MPLGTEVDLGPGHIVLDGDLLPQMGTACTAPAPIISPCLLWPNDWMDQMPFGIEVSLGPGHTVLQLSLIHI